MARSFRDNEKNAIRSCLMEKGRELFATHGLKGTGIGDLTAAAGISQGSFYVFFGSKEELYFDILELEEERLAAALRELFDAENVSKNSLKVFLKKYFELVYQNPLIANLIRHREYELVMRKLPEEKKRKHLLNEAGLFGSIINPLLDEGSVRQVRPEVLSALFHALFLLQLHRSDIGEAVFPDMMELFTDLISEGLVLKEKQV